MMKKIFSALILSSLLIAGCIKKDTKCSYGDFNASVPGSELDSLKTLLTDSGITATQHSAGFFYKISNSGAGASITNLCTNITVTYKGSFFNGHVFDSTANGNVATFQLGQVLGGWQKGVPLISKDGEITLYLPPTLGYGPNPYPNQGNIIIPGNSYLIFNIHIVDIQ